MIFHWKFFLNLKTNSTDKRVHFDRHSYQVHVDAVRVGPGVLEVLL